MRLLMSVLLSLLAVTCVSADGMGEFKSAKAQAQANMPRQNTIQITETQGIFLQSRSLTYTAATNVSAAITAYDQVDIAAGTFPDEQGKGKVEIQIDNLNITQIGAGKNPNLNVQKFAFAMRPFSVVQYVETAAIQNGFDANDTKCQEYQIRPNAANPFKFKWLAATNMTVGNGSVIVHTFSGASADGVFGLVIKAIGTVGTTNTIAGQAAQSRAVTIDGRFVQPTSIKFDVVMNVTQPAFKLNKTAACANYQIALKSWARSSQEVFARTTTKQTVNGTTTTNTAVTFLDRIQTGGAATPFGFFTWAATANVTKWIDNTTTQQVAAGVLATSLVVVQNDEDHDDKIITKEAVHSFNVTRPAVIHWDPELGSDVTNPDAADPTVSSSSSSTGAGAGAGGDNPTPTPNTSSSSTPSTSSSSSSTGPARSPNSASTTSFSIVTMVLVAVLAMFA